jgi:hypothetical protein
MRRPAPDDVGLELVNHVYDLMQIDSKWTVWGPRGFTWWGWHFAQRVWAEPPFQDDGFSLSRVHARTDVWDDFDGRDQQMMLLGIGGMATTMYGFIQSAERPSCIQLASSVYVHAEILDWMRNLFSMAVATQVAEGAILSGMPGDLYGMRPAKSAHPESGPRVQMDDMLNIIRDVVSPKGEARSAYAGEEMRELLALLNKPPCVLATGDRRSISAEFPYPNSTSLIQLETEDKNPRVGNGLLALLTIPDGAHNGASRPSAGTNDIVQALEKGVDAWRASGRSALKLNAREIASSTRAHFLGSWRQSDKGLTYASFYPNCLYRRGCLQNLAMNHIMRARWISEDVLGYGWEEHFQEALQRKVATLRRAGQDEHAKKRGFLAGLFGKQARG